MKKSLKMIRQGDVLLVKVGAPPETALATAVKQPLNRHGRIVLAQGESTLHEHTVDATDAELIAIGEQMLLHVKSETATVRTTHVHTGKTLPRHTPQELGGDYYRVVRQRELHPKDMKKYRIVAD